MLNQSVVTTTVGAARKTILIDTHNFYALPVVLGNAGIAANAEGKKIIKAGTPITGNLEARNTAFVLTALPADVVGVVEHDVDVTAGNANGGVILTALIDASKLEADIQALLTVAMKAALPTIKFVK